MLAFLLLFNMLLLPKSFFAPVNAEEIPIMATEEVLYGFTLAGTDLKDTLYIPKMSYFHDVELGECLVICQGSIYYKTDEVGNTLIDSIDKIELAWIGVKKEGELKVALSYTHRWLRTDCLSKDFLNYVKLQCLTTMKNSRYVSSKDPSCIESRVPFVLPLFFK